MKDNNLVAGIVEEDTNFALCIYLYINVLSLTDVPVLTRWARFRLYHHIFQLKAIALSGLLCSLYLIVPRIGQPCAERPIIQRRREVLFISLNSHMNSSGR
ncbi:uncharacterized protein EV420DRAFT_1180597 [Desarmillaria tabescens]|uniref:Uncharacterized protein n=1 Tax=Armillaria tabescens TaxID=1929756 RepID=A0AA39NAY3_ARMTA|nr:uncharacterized protein EV420DRAFT_1180597 [Desarmillaria tabescens]KAK0462276.1 hypothetical protein EV420DRAFT_1180597 [Desarmillaria tabescens]